MTGGGLTVNEALFVLAKATPAEVRPVIDTRYWVGVETVIVLGIWNVTRRVVPMTVATALAGVVPPGPPAAGSTSTVTSAGAITPDGKFDPVTLML